MRRWGLGLLGLCATLTPYAACDSGDDTSKRSQTRCSPDDTCDTGFHCQDGFCVPDGAEGDAGTTADASTSDASPGPCAPGDPGCICEWSPAERLASAPNGFGSIGYHLAYDSAGGAIAAWGVDSEYGQGPLTVRALDPATERWTEAVQLFELVSSTRFARTAEGTLLAFASDIDGYSWSAFDPETRRFSTPALVGQAATSFVTNGEFTYLVNHPIVTRFTGEGWTPSAITQPDFHWEPPAIAADDHGNLVAAWADLSPTGVREGISANYYDAATDTWSWPEKLATSGAGPSVMFDGDGDAHVVWADGDGFLARRRVAGSGTWSDPLGVIGAPMLRDEDGDLHALGSECQGPGCGISVAQFDRQTDAWLTSTIASGTGVTEGPVVATARDKAVALWLEDCDAEGACTARASLLDGATSWGEPETVMNILQWDFTADPQQGLALGDDGTAAFVWWEDDVWPYVEPAKILAVRYDPSEGWGEPTRLDQADVFRPLAAVDARGYSTALWNVSIEPESPSSYTYPVELWSSRWACRTETPPGTPRDAGSDPESLPEPPCLDDGQSGSCGACQWSAPRRIATDVFSPTESNVPAIVGAGSGGHIVVAWGDRRGVYVASRAPDGTWSEPSLLMPATESADYPRISDVVVDASGAALVLLETWETSFAWAPPSASPALSWSTVTTLPGESMNIEELQKWPGSVVVVMRDPDGYEGGRVSRFDFATGTWSHSPTLVGLPCSVQIAAVSSGSTVSAYALVPSAPDGTCGPPSTLLHTSLSGASWSLPATLTDVPTTVWFSRLSPDESGNVAITWTEADTVWGAYYDGAAGLTTPQHIGSMAPCSYDVRLVRGSNRVTAVWSNTGGISGCNSGETGGVWSSHLDTGTGLWTNAESVSIAPLWRVSMKLDATALGDDVLAWWSDQDIYDELATSTLQTVRWSGASDAWLAPVRLDGPPAVNPRFGKDGAGNVHFIWDRGIQGEVVNSWVIHANRLDAVTGAFSSQPSALSQERPVHGVDSYDLDVSDSGIGAAAWGSEISVWATVWDCSQ